MCPVTISAVNSALPSAWIAAISLALVPVERTPKASPPVAIAEERTTRPSCHCPFGAAVPLFVIKCRSCTRSGPSRQCRSRSWRQVYRGRREHRCCRCPSRNRSLDHPFPLEPRRASRMPRFGLSHCPSAPDLHKPRHRECKACQNTSWRRCWSPAHRRRPSRC
jgi:hypothetical protein